jgi:phage gp36-like protein
MPIDVPVSVGPHYATPELIVQMYGKTLVNFAYDLDNSGSWDPDRMEWSLCRADEVINTKLGKSRYPVPLVSTGGPLLLIPDYAARIAFFRAYKLRGSELEKGQRARYGKDYKCVLTGLSNIFLGFTEINAVLDPLVSVMPLG